MKKIAISLLTCNDLKLAELSIRSLLKSDINVNDIKLFWWDNTSTEYIDEFKATIEELQIPTYSIFSKKNEGIVIPRIKLYEQIVKENYDYLLEIHADMVFPKNWIKEVFKLEDDRTVIMMPTIWQPRSRFTDKQVTEFSEKNKKNTITENSLQVHPWIIRLNLLDKVGGYYDSRYSPMRLEDDDLVFRIINNGYKMKATGNSIVCHYGALTRRGMKGTSNEVFFKKNKITIQEWISKLNKHPSIQS